MKKHILILLAAVLTTAVPALSQGRKALRINEVMVSNQNSVVDDFGRHSAWIELFNTNFAPLEISSVYITTDPAKPRMYPVPLGDVNTRIPKRQHIIFWADGMPKDGTFHTNFVLTPGQDNWIGIYDADGKTLIDSITVPASLQTDQTYARTIDGEGVWKVRTGGKQDYITPSSANKLRETNERVEQFAEHDEYGFSMTLMAMGIVFSALFILCLCFYAISEIGNYVSRLNKARVKGVDVTELRRKDHDSGEEIAAIVMALHQHFNSHDDESNMLTIRKIKRAYSPWSSKIYGLRELPRR